MPARGDRPLTAPHRRQRAGGRGAPAGRARHSIPARPGRTVPGGRDFGRAMAPGGGGTGRRGGPRRAHFVCRPGARLARRACRGRRGPGRPGDGWSGRRAAARASATTPSSCRTAGTGLFGEMGAGEEQACDQPPGARRLREAGRGALALPTGRRRDTPRPSPRPEILLEILPPRGRTGGAFAPLWSIGRFCRSKCPLLRLQNSHVRPRHGRPGPLAPPPLLAELDHFARETAGEPGALDFHLPSAAAPPSLMPPETAAAGDRPGAVGHWRPAPDPRGHAGSQPHLGRGGGLSPASPRRRE